LPAMGECGHPMKPAGTASAFGVCSTCSDSSPFRGSDQPSTASPLPLLFLAGGAAGDLRRSSGSSGASTPTPEASSFGAAGAADAMVTGRGRDGLCRSGAARTDRGTSGDMTGFLVYGPDERLARFDEPAAPARPAAGSWIGARID